MYVIKRDGRREAVKFDKITARVKKLCYGLDPMVDAKDPESFSRISHELQNAGAERIWYIGDAFRAGLSVEGGRQSSRHADALAGLVRTTLPWLAALSLALAGQRLYAVRDAHLPAGLQRHRPAKAG